MQQHEVVYLAHELDAVFQGEQVIHEYIPEEGQAHFQIFVRRLPPVRP